MKPKIAFVQNVPFSDHRMVHTDGVARELVKRGYCVDVVIQKSDHMPCIEDVPYNVVEVPGSTYSFIGQTLFMFRLYLLLRGKNYDIIHAKNPFSSVLPALMCKHGSRVIYDMRGLWIDFGVHAGDIPGFMAPLLWRIDLWCMKKADKVIAISHELKKELVKRDIDGRHVDVIVSDGVNYEMIQNLELQDIRDYLGIEGEVVGYVGTISSSRFSEKIIEAFKHVHDKVNSAKLVMIGPCKELLYFSKLVDQFGLTDCVFFTGFLPHVLSLKYMKSFDVAVSYHESDLPFFNVAVPTKILEYLACGCSIVTTDQKMYLKILTNKIDGYLTSQDPQLFSEGIIYILKNKELAQILSINALKTAKKYSLKKILYQIEKTYKEIS